MDVQIIYKNNEKVIYKLLKRIYTQINNENHCFIMTDIHHFLCINIQTPEKYSFIPPLIKDYEVPLPLIDLKPVEQYFDVYDPNLSKLISQIDGVSYVKQIAKDTSLDIDIIKLCLQNLIFNKVITMIDIFQFSNIYITTNEIHNFMSSNKKQEECLKFVVKEEFVDKIDRIELINLFICLTNKIPLKDFILENSAKIAKINISKFIQYGLIHKLIRRVHYYPIQKKDNELPFIDRINYKSYLNRNIFDKDESPQQVDDIIRKLNQEFNEFIDGTHCLDEICVHFEKNKLEIEEKMRGFGIYIIEK